MLIEKDVKEENYCREDYVRYLKILIFSITRLSNTSTELQFQAKYLVPTKMKGS